MAFAAAAERASAVSDINVTPLVDVMLVLLIIFMVTAPILSRELPFDLPQKGPTPPIDVEHLQLAIDADGVIRLDGRVLPPALLDASLRLEALRSPQPELQIDAAGEAGYQAFTTVLAAARNAGLARISLRAVE